MRHTSVYGEFARRRGVKIMHNGSTRRDGRRVRIFRLGASSTNNLLWHRV